MPRFKLETAHQGDMIYNPEEPFFILDPRNSYAPSALRALINTLNNAGGEQGQLAAIDVSEALTSMEVWQANNHTETGPPQPRNVGSIGLDPDDFVEPEAEEA